MRMTRHKALYQLTYLPNVFPVNCYFIEEEDGLTLIDAALPNNVKAIMEAAKRIGKPITRIVLTHIHTDHIGALDGLKELLPSVPVWMPAREVKFLDGDLSLEQGEPNTPIRGGIPKNVKTRPDYLVRDGNRIGSLVAIAVPGHTPGSIAYQDTRGGELIAGDAFQLKGGIAVSGQLRPLFPFPALATWDKKSALESARKLLKAAPSLLAVGHGNVLLAPENAMKQAIARAERNLAGK